MSKVFLSHCSADKEWYVRHVYNHLAKSLGEDSIYIDEVSFQQGRRTIEEIKYSLNNSDLFVIFLSDKALESEWVMEELSLVKQIIEEKSIQICPIIIDDRIKYDDLRIPSWLKDEYNIQQIKKVKKASDIIFQRMTEISYKKHPRLLEQKRIFVGRNEQIRIIEERLDDFDKEKPIVIITSGLDGVGRSSLLKNGLIKSNIIKESFDLPEIVLNNDESIEDCILKLSDLGFTSTLDVTELYNEETEKKTDRLKNIIKELQDEKEIVLIKDFGCIVNHEGKIAEWFYNAVTSEVISAKITLLIASKFKYYRAVKYTDRIFEMSLQELSFCERKGLLNRLLEFDGLEIEKEKRESIIEILSGFPEQVKYAVYILSKYGYAGFDSRRKYVLDFNKKKAAALLQEIKDREELMGFLVLLSSFDYVSTSFINQITNDEKSQQWIEEFYLYGILEYVGTAKEYVRINDTIKDYMQRSAYSMPEEYKKNLKIEAKKIICQLNEADQGDYSIPEILYSLKESLKEGNSIEDKYIIPSIYLKTMNDLYYDGKYDSVISFADKALESVQYMDKSIVFELRYLLCLSLAQNRDRRFLREVQNINGADHSFLFGFYYRRKGQFSKALQSINDSLKLKPSFSKAKREKVQILIGMQEYDAALEMARENYENYKENPYHIHAYFTCLIKMDNPSTVCDVLNILLNDIDEIDSNLGKEMGSRMHAQYSAFVDHDYEKAMVLIDEAILLKGNKIYGRIAKFDIAEKFQNINDMESVIEFFNVDDYKKRYHDNIVYMKSIVKAMSGNSIEAEEYFKSEIKNYTTVAQERVIQKLRKLGELFDLKTRDCDKTPWCQAVRPEGRFT